MSEKTGGPVTEISLPLVPAEVDLTDFAFMPLDVVRLRDSDLAAEETPEACWAALLLWAASWHQVPAGSIPDSEQWQAKHAGYVARGRIDKGWAEIRDGALRNWVKCSDGRLYHPVVAEKAIVAWREKLARRARTKAATEAREARSRAQQVDRDVDRNGERDDVGTATSRQADPQRDVERDVHQGKGREGTGRVKGQGQGQGVLNSSPGASHPPRRKAGEPTPTTDAWNAYAERYRSHYGAEPVRNAMVNGQLSQLVARLGAEAPEVAAFYVGHPNRLYASAMHPVNLLLRDAERLRTEWATGRRTTVTEASNGDRTQTNLNAFAPLLAQAEAEKANG